MNPPLREAAVADREMARLAGISPSTLRSKVKSGFFQPGTHFHDINPGGQRAHRRWHVAAALAALDVETVNAAHLRTPPTTYRPVPVAIS